MSGTILGILSDSHGRADTTALAVRSLLDHGATTLVHLGDIGTESVLDELVGHDAHVIFGNCDDERSLARYARAMQIAIHHPVGSMTMDGRRVMFTHGHLQHAFDDAIAAAPDYLLTGHTHQLRDERQGKTRLINPGALFRARRYTAAILEPASDRLEFIEIPH